MSYFKNCSILLGTKVQFYLLKLIYIKKYL